MIYEMKNGKWVERKIRDDGTRFSVARWQGRKDVKYGTRVDEVKVSR
jgi:hypothetical protein